MLARSALAAHHDCSAAAFIGNLVANEECKYQIIHDGGLTILIKLTAAHGAPSYKAHAARGLANLALHDEAHVPMLERGILQILSVRPDARLLLL